jgi:hypothetical protein
VPQLTQRSILTNTTAIRIFCGTRLDIAYSAIHNKNGVAMQIKKIKYFVGIVIESSGWYSGAEDTLLQEKRI